MQVLDLFSGIGGFSLGLERAGMKTVAFCEVDAKARAVLKKHWPDVPIFEDVKTLRGADINERIDVICGGFPCQDISLAGAGAGLAGERSGLWFEFLRLIEEIRPRYAIIENVAALRVNGLEAVLQGLNAIGYGAEWHCISASSVGAPHQRDRIWIIAFSESLRRVERFGAAAQWRGLLWPGQLDCSASWSSAENNHKIRSAAIRVVDGLPGRVDRLKQLGNAVVPQIPQLIGEAIMFEEMCK